MTQTKWPFPQSETKPEETVSKPSQSSGFKRPAVATKKAKLPLIKGYEDVLIWTISANTITSQSIKFQLMFRT